MQIGKIIHPIRSLGINTRIGIWTTGCFRNCFNCSNPELQYEDKDKDIGVDKIIDLLKTYQFDGVTISGGEPFLQIHDLYLLVKGINEELNIDDILIFTGYTKKELDNMHNEDINYILNHISVLVDGPYIEDLHTEEPLKGSSNQQIIILNKKYEKDYLAYLSKEKTFDIVDDGHITHFVGIPMKNYQENYQYYLKGRKKK